MMQIRERVKAKIKKMLDPNGGQVFSLFKSYLVKALFKLVYDSYNSRSKGRIDKYGFQWEPLSDFTVSTKIAKGRSEKRAKTIMVDTRRLLRSYKPGTVSVSGYSRSNDDQMFVIMKMTVKIGSNVEYLKFSKRPILPEGMIELVVQDALKIALRNVAPHMERLLK